MRCAAVLLKGMVMNGEQLDNKATSTCTPLKETLLMCKCGEIVTAQCRVREAAWTWTWELDCHRADLHSASHCLCDLRHVVQLLGAITYEIGDMIATSWEDSMK